MNRIRSGALLALTCFGVAGCSHPSDTAEAAGAQAAGSSRVAAHVDGVPISWDEMDKRAAERLTALRQDEYEARSEALNDLIYEKLLASEAKRRGLTTEALLREEVTGKVEKPTPAEVEAIYEANKERVQGQPKAPILVEIENHIYNQRLALRQGGFRKELLGKGTVATLLEPPRFEITLPPTSPSLGPKEAKLTLVEFSDYQCPYCHQAQSVVEEILKKYDGKLRFVHGEYPLPQHPRAFAASVASRCAGDQGKYWEYHKGLLQVASDYGDADLKARATKLGVDATHFGECLASGRHDAAIEASRQFGSAVGVNSTPTFFVNGRKLRGVRSIEDFETIFREELARAGS